MDEILRTPQYDATISAHKHDSEPAPAQDQVAKLQSGLLRLADTAAAYGRRLHLQGTRVFHRAHSAVAGKPKMGPLPFLALSAVLGVAAVTSVVYTPAYVVNVDGVNLGIVKDPSVFEQAVDRVEARASDILGYSYTLHNEVTYEQALIQRNQLSSAADFDTYLFNQVGEVMKSYTLTVDGQFIGAATDRTALDGLLDTISAPFVNENTVSVDYDKAVHISYEYTPSNVQQDVEEMRTFLIANTNGQTTYEVKKGDTFMALAYDNGMTMEEMKNLNPDVDIERLYIGQILNVKEVVPFLSVRTTDEITYSEAIASPVREVKDDNMYEGDSKVLDAGIPGEAMVTADITYVNGTERERNVIDTTVVSEPTEKVIAVGTMPRPSWLPTGNYVWPVYGSVTSAFGYRSIFGSYSYHSGMDIAVPYGTTVKASDGGTVIWSGYKGSLGNLVIIDHGNGEQTYYGHNGSLLVSVGDKVYQGQAIAKAGSTGRSTGSHCHFEIKINGTSVNPRPYLN